MYCTRVLSYATRQDAKNPAYIEIGAGDGRCRRKLKSMNYGFRYSGSDVSHEGISYYYIMEGRGRRFYIHALVCMQRKSAVDVCARAREEKTYYGPSAYIERKIALEK